MKSAPVPFEVADELASLDHAVLRGENALFAPTTCVSRHTRHVPTLQLSIVYELVEGGWTQARIAEYPAVITAAPTREGAKELVLDALREYLLSLAEEPPGEAGERESVALTITA